MSVICQTPVGFLVCHRKYLENVYAAVNMDDGIAKLSPHEDLFRIKTPYMKDAEARRIARDDSKPRTTKRKFEQMSATDLKVRCIQRSYQHLLEVSQNLKHLIFEPSLTEVIDNNKSARAISEKLYNESSDWTHAPFSGGNTSNEVLIQKIGSHCFVFPPKCNFFCQDVNKIQENVELLGTFDLILLDPPWWNRYIRRKKAKRLQEGYQMMYNECLADIPVRTLLAPGGIIAVWCTNSESHQEELKEKLLPRWGAKPISQWTWIKVTQSGLPVCAFAEPPGKQPFEQLIFGVREEEEEVSARPQDGKIFMSVPSSIHSHKPPISELMKPYLPSEPRCLEIFARYLLPNWTSWGLEVIKLQHLSLFQQHPIQ